MPQLSNSSGFPFLGDNQQPFQSTQLLEESKKIFPLINTILSWEDCLQYQIIPLSLKHQQLTIGIVDSNNTSAIEKIQYLGESEHYSIHLQEIRFESYQTVLWSYFQNHEDEPPSQENSTKKKSVRLDERPTFIIKTPEELQQEEAEKESSLSSLEFELDGPHHPVPLHKLPPLNLSPEYESQTPDFLLTLTPKQLFFELVAQVLTDGVGRLYFQRSQDHGCIFLTQNGISKLVLENIKLNLFQGLIYELKYFIRYPLTPVKKTKTIEMNRRYCQEQILLRLQLMPNQFGEEATLQVLRGEALQFHQQQKIHKVSQDALKLAQYLERKIKQLETCYRFTETSLDLIPLKKQLHKINQKLNNIH